MQKKNIKILIIGGCFLGGKNIGLSNLFFRILAKWFRDNKNIKVSFSLKSFEEYSNLKEITLEYNKIDSPDLIIIQMRTIIYLKMVKLFHWNDILYKKLKIKKKQSNTPNQESSNEWMTPPKAYKKLINYINVFSGIALGRKKKAENNIVTIFNSFSESEASLSSIYVIGIFNSTFSHLLNRCYGELNSRLISFFKGNPITYINVYDKLNESEAKGITVQLADKHHYNAEAHKVVANSIIEIFSKKF